MGQIGVTLGGRGEGSCFPATVIAVSALGRGKDFKKNG